MAEKTIQIADKPTVDEILALLENAEVGLAALRLLLGNSADATTMNAVKGILENGTYGLNALDKDLGRITNYLANSTYGLAALKNAITGRANETTVAAVKALLENGTYGLNALKTAINNVNKFSSITAGVLQINTKLTLGDYDGSYYRSYVGYSPELSISGSGQIVFYDAHIGDTNNHTGSWTTRLADLVVDGKNIPTEPLNNGKFGYNGFTIASGKTGEKGMKCKVEFGKSFKCKLGFYCSTGTTTDFNIVQTASANYFVQLR